MDAKARAARIKLIAFDIDGVMTDGGLHYSDDGHEFKTFNVQDGLGIVLLKRVGIEVAIITGRNSGVVSHRAADLGVAHVYQGVGNKRDVAEKLLQMGADEIDLGDTIGAATTSTTKALLNEYNALDEVADPDVPITLHLHDTFGHAADCVKTALDLGIRCFDASVAGLGGCPYASTPGKRAPGNISTELLIRTIHAAGHKTNVDLNKLEIAATFARDIVAKSRAVS